MAYTQTEKGSLNDVNQLIDNLHNFILNNTDFNVVDFSAYESYGKRLIIQKEGLYFNIYSSMKRNIYFNTDNNSDYLWIFMSDSFDPSKNFKQASDATETEIYNIMPFQDDIPFYGFYWNGENFVVVAEYDNGFYSFMNFGKHESFGSWSINVTASNLTRTTTTPDRYYEPLFNQQAVFADGKWFNGRGTGGTVKTTSTGVGTFATADVLGSSLTELNDKSALFYDMFYFHNTDRNLMQPMGQNIDMAFCSAEFMTPQEEFFVGSKKFVFFPFWQKEDPIDYSNSKNKGMGIALRLV